MRALSQGDEEAFRCLYENYGRELFCFVKKLGLEPDDAMEMVQETFLRIWNDRRNAALYVSVKVYIFTIARNLVYSHLRKVSVRRRYADEISSRGEGVSLPDTNELFRLVEHLLEQLPERRRLIFRMSRLEGYPNQRIAEKLNLSKSTVENHLNKGLKQMRKLLEQYGYKLPFAVVLILHEIF